MRFGRYRIRNRVPPVIPHQPKGEDREIPRATASIGCFDGLRYDRMSSRVHAIGRAESLRRENPFRLYDTVQAGTMPVAQPNRVRTLTAGRPRSEVALDGAVTVQDNGEGPSSSVLPTVGKQGLSRGRGMQFAY